MAEEQKEIITDPVLMQENRNLQILQKSLAGALKEVFGEYTENQRFLDLKRVPLICKDVANIAKMLQDEKEAREKSAADIAKSLEGHRTELGNSLKEIKDKVDSKYVTTEAFTPIKNIVYGGVAFILLAVLGAIVYLVVQKPG